METYILPFDVRSNSLLLHGGWPIAKVFINQSFFFLVIIFPPKTPNINPHSYPIATTFQSNSNRDIASLFSTNIEGWGGGSFKLAYHFDNGLPHNPTFPLNELFSNVRNCFPCCIVPVRWLWDRLKKSKECKLYQLWRNLSNKHILRKVVILGFLSLPMTMEKN